MRLDQRHTVLETTPRLKLVRRVNDFAIVGAITGNIISIVPFYPSGFTVDKAEENARAIFDMASGEGWR